MSEHVQAYDPDHGVYRKIHVATGKFVEERRSPFPGIDEVDELERKHPKKPQRYDPLGGYR
jgi:hypothetical protein